MRKNKKLFAILTLVAFMMTLMPVLAFAGPATSVAFGENAISYTKDGIIIAPGSGNGLWPVVSGALGDEVADPTQAIAITDSDVDKQYVAVATGAAKGDTLDAENLKRAYTISQTDVDIVAALGAYDTFSGISTPNVTQATTFTNAFDEIADDTDAVDAFYAGVSNETIAKILVQQAYAKVCADAFNTYYGDTAQTTARDKFDATYDLAGSALADELDALSMDADLAKKVHEAKVANKAGLIEAAKAAGGVEDVVDAVKAFDAEKTEANYATKADLIVSALPVDWTGGTDEENVEAINNGLKDSGLSAAQIKLVVDLFSAGADTTLKNEIIADYKGSGSGPTTPTTPSGVSVDASIIATKDANASIEAEGSARQDGKGGLVYTVVKDNGDKETKGLLDTKYAEVELVLREANNASFKGTDTVYVWAEESGKSRQATDALVIDKGSNEKDADITDPIKNDSYNVYAIPVTGTETIKVAFLRAGTYTLKASIVDPTGGDAKNGLLASNVSTFKTVANKNTVTATSLAQETRKFKVDVAAGKNATAISKNLGDGEKTTDSGDNISNVIVKNDGYVIVNADTVATTKVAITVKNKNGDTMPTYPIRLSTSSANIELDETNVTTDYKGVAEFNVAGVREGEYKIYVNIGDYEGTIMVKVGATSANDIQLIKFPSNPIATDTLVDDYKDIFRFQLTDANGNIVTGHEPKGAKYASIASDGDKSTAEMAKYAYIVSAPEANKVKNADLKLIYVDKPTNKDYYTLGIDNNKAFEAEGDYEVRVVLDNGKSVTLNFSVKKFDKAVSLHIEYPTTAVELNSLTEKPDIYFLDANRVMKKANNRVTVAAQGYAVASVVENGDNAGVLKIKNDEKYVGQTITVTAASDKENLMASTTLTVADEAREVKLDTNRGPVNANNRVGFKVVDSTGAPVALGRDATVEVTAVVTNTGDPDAKVSYSVTGSSKADLMEKGTGVINLSANKQTTATVQIMVKVTKTNRNATSGSLETNDKDNNTGLSTTYYSGTETFTFGAEADKSVVMTIGSKEIVAQNVPVTIDVAPFIQDNRTYVPFRALVEAFGAEVDYNADNNTVTTKLDGKTVVLTVGSTVLTVNDETVTMDVAPFIVDDRVVVPVRFVGEAFGFTVEATQDADTGATASVVFYQK